MKESLASFAEDLKRWLPAQAESYCAPAEAAEGLADRELRELDQKLSACWPPLRLQEEQLRRQLNEKWRWNPVFSDASLLEPLAGMALEPVMTKGLAWLLRPSSPINGRESLRTALLRSFLGLICEGKTPQESELNGWQSEPEFPVPGSNAATRQRIDIVLRGSLSGQQVVIGVEAKIHSGLGERQLERYSKALHKAFRNRNIRMVYLTPGGQLSRTEGVIDLSYATVADALVPVLRTHETDPAAGFAHLLLSDLVRGQNAGRPARAWHQADAGILARIRTALSCLDEMETQK